MHTNLKAGTAAVTITPDRPLYLQGHSQDHPAIGTLDLLEARVIALDDGRTRAAIVSADLIGLDASSVGRIRKVAESASGIPGANVMVSCTHTHSGPAVMRLHDYRRVDRRYLGWLEQTLGDAVGTASQSMRPAVVAAGEGGPVDFNVNRRLPTPDGVALRPNPDGVVDRRVRVVRIDPAESPEPRGTVGEEPLPQTDPIAILYSYVCHPTALTSWKSHNSYSADYPGAARRVVEASYNERNGGGAIAMFLPGCFGDVRPNLQDNDGAFRSATVQELQVLGRSLGTEVVQVAERLVGQPVDSIGLASAMVTLPYSHVPDEAELRGMAGDERLGIWAEGLLEKLGRDGGLAAGDTAGEVAVIRIGRHWTVSLPGEPMLEIGWSIERGLAELRLADPERGDLALALGYTNGSNVGYLCTSEAMLEGGCEAERSYIAYHHPGPFVREIEQTLIVTAIDLASKLAGV